MLKLIEDMLAEATRPQPTEGTLTLRTCGCLHVIPLTERSNHEAR